MANVRGLFEIVVANQLRKEIQSEGWLIAGGVLSVLFGLLLFARPHTGALALLWMIGVFALLFGADPDRARLQAQSSQARGGLRRDSPDPGGHPAFLGLHLGFAGRAAMGR